MTVVIAKELLLNAYKPDCLIAGEVETVLIEGGLMVSCQLCGGVDNEK